MPSINYHEIHFEFQTVCYKSTFKYSICLYGYEHEYVSYISDSGEINEQSYERVVQNILDMDSQKVKPEI